METEPESLRPLPWEDANNTEGRVAKALATVKALFGDPSEAGRAIGARAQVGPAVGFFAFLGLPCQWIATAMARWAQAGRPDQMAYVMRYFHLPEQPAPTAQQLAFQSTLGWFQVAAFPLIAAIGMLIFGALAHGGLWMVKGLRNGKGIEISYRTLLYASGAFGWIGLINAAGVFLPGGAFWVHQAFSLALALGFITFQGMLLAEAHGVERWRGIVGVFLPGFILCCLCACCAGALGAGIASLSRGHA